MKTTLLEKILLLIEKTASALLEIFAPLLMFLLVSVLLGFSLGCAGYALEYYDTALASLICYPIIIALLVILFWFAGTTFIILKMTFSDLIK